ncbi:MAG TPA: ethylbenzene dehydrogenase-related protein [Burkholderiales bacterium]|nr:ethylbenzene dehydrogenase-related protein [Burkholderiales bacterium]
MKKAALSLGLLCACSLAGSAWAADPATIDWNQVPSGSLTLFYPGQSTFQWLRSPAHKGASVVAYGTPCVSCHKGQEAKLGDRIVKGGPLEPTPPAGKNGSLALNVQVAYDDQNAYFRFQWKTRGGGPGESYPAYRFDGKEWKPHGAPRLSAPAYKGEQPAVYEDRLSMMIDDGAVPNFAAQGCWLTCHNGERDAPGQPKAAEVAANPFYQAIKKADVRKYLPATRSDANASWDKAVSVDEVSKLKAEGKFLDLIQWRAHRSNPVGMADDGYVLEWRNFDAGSNMFASNMDPKTKQPRFMFAPGKTGKILLRDENAVPFDPNAGWKEGDVLPQYVVSDKLAAGSAADNKYAKGVWKDGMWTVVWARPLNLKNPDDKTLQEGKSYTFGFAVHDDNITTRGHHISFPVSVGFGAKADIQATKLK